MFIESPTFCFCNNFFCFAAYNTSTVLRKLWSAIFPGNDSLKIITHDHWKDFLLMRSGYRRIIISLLPTYLLSDGGPCLCLRQEEEFCFRSRSMLISISHAAHQCPNMMKHSLWDVSFNFLIKSFYVFLCTWLAGWRLSKEVKEKKVFCVYLRVDDPNSILGWNFMVSFLF